MPALILLLMGLVPRCAHFPSCRRTGGLRNRRAHKRTVLSAPSSSAPALAGEENRKRSRGANASELCHHQASSKTQPLARRKARGAERRKTQSNHCPPCKQVGATSAACLRSGRRRATECAACATPLLAGRARLPAHRCGSRQGFDLLTQLQAMLPGMFARRALPAGSQAQCRDSTSRRGRSTAGRDARSRWGAVCETARRRRIPLRNQDRIRNAPLGERDCLAMYPIWRRLSMIMRRCSWQTTTAPTRLRPARLGAARR